MPSIFKQYPSIGKDKTAVVDEVKEAANLLVEHNEEMGIDREGTKIDPPTGGTPSTASRIRPVAVENAFPTPTPPRRQQSRAPGQPDNGREPPGLSKFMHLGKSSPAPKECRSVEALIPTTSRENGTGLSSTSELENSWHRRVLSKKNSLYFDQVFTAREPYNSARERLARDSVVMAELQINEAAVRQQRVFEQDEAGDTKLQLHQSFLNDLLLMLSETYHKPQNNIMISAIPNAQVIAGGSTDPAYLITITALSSEIATVKNIRATMKLQDFFNDTLNVPPSRGIMKFHQIREADLGTDGTTLKGEIERLEAKEKTLGSLRSRQGNKASKKSTLPSMSEMFGDMQPSRSDTPILFPNSMDCEQEEKPHRSEPSTKAIKMRKSIMTFWRKV